MLSNDWTYENYDVVIMVYEGQVVVKKNSSGEDIIGLNESQLRAKFGDKILVLESING